MSSTCRSRSGYLSLLAVVLAVGMIDGTHGDDASSNRFARATSLSLENIIGFTPRDVLLESLESKTCFDLKNRGQTPGTEVVLNTCGFPTPLWNQLFTLQDVDGQHFTITNRAASCLSFSTGSSQQLTSSNQCSGDGSRFYLDTSADGQSFLIRQKSTGKCVTPSGSGGTSGNSEALKPVTCDRNDSRQFWRIFSKDKPRRFAPHPSRCLN